MHSNCRLQNGGHLSAMEGVERAHSSPASWTSIKWLYFGTGWTKIFPNTLVMCICTNDNNITNRKPFRSCKLCTSWTMSSFYVGFGRSFCLSAVGIWQLSGAAVIISLDLRVMYYHCHWELNGVDIQHIACTIHKVLVVVLGFVVVILTQTVGILLAIVSVCFVAQFIESEWRVYAPVKSTIIGSENGRCGTKPLSERMLTHCQLATEEQIALICKSKVN